MLCALHVFLHVVFTTVVLKGYPPTNKNRCSEIAVYNRIVKLIPHNYNCLFYEQMLKKKKSRVFSTMAFFCSPPKTRKSNRNHYSIASHDLHNHSYPSRDQEYLQEISKTKQYQPSSRNYAFSANNAQTSTMTLQI